MVYTRSKARQKASESAQIVSSGGEDPQTSQQVVKRSSRSVKKTRQAVVQATPDQESEVPPRDEDEQSVEELALRAFQVMKERLGRGSTEAGDQGTRGMGMETENDTELDILMLESDGKSKPPLRDSRSGAISTSLQPCMKEKPYFSFKKSLKSTPSSASRLMAVSWGERDEDLMKKSVITPDFEKRETAPPMYVSKYAKAKARKAAREKSAGRGWYEMQAPEVTSELKNDLKLLRMRNALDPSRHYKASDWRKLPRYFQVGKVVSGPAEFYSSRVPKRQRKQTIMDELLHNHQFRKYHKKKYSELQRKFTSGTRRKRFIKHKKHYKK